MANTTTPIEKVSAQNVPVVQQIRRLLTDASRLVSQLGQIEESGGVQLVCFKAEDDIDKIRKALFDIQ